MSAAPRTRVIVLVSFLLLIHSVAEPPVARAECNVTPSPFWKNTVDFNNDPWRYSDDSGGASWIKFTILTCDPPTVYFQYGHQHLFHYDFATDVLDPFVGLSIDEFNDISLHAAGQEAILGAVILPPTTGVFFFQPRFQEFGIQLIRNDAYTPAEVVDLFHRVKAAVNADPNVEAYYFPTFEQQTVASANIDFLAANGVPVSSPARWLDGNACYSRGWALGRLNYVPAADIEDAYLAGTLAPQDILLTDSVPAEIPFVAGVVSLNPSTPNSHVAILADSFDVPFAFLANAQDVDRALSLVGRRVVLRAYGDTIRGDIRFIDAEDQLTAEMESEILGLKSPPPLNITPVAPADAMTLPVEGMSLSAIKHVGGKAANYSLLRAAIPEHSVPAFALTFDVWNSFLSQTLGNGRTLRQEIDLRLSGYSYPPDFEALTDDLDDIRDMIKDEDETSFDPAVRAAIIAALQDPQYGFSLGSNIRFRSSTNVEDSDQFVGAGLYDSESGCLPDDLDADDDGPSHCDDDDDERGVFRAIRRVFDSFYHDNAFLERLRYGVDENNVGMAVLVHHSYPDEIELANGVAVLQPTVFGYEMTLITQNGAISVTNPTGETIPEEVRVYDFGTAISPAFVSGSNLVQLGGRVLTWPDDYIELGELLIAVAEEFEQATGKTNYVLDFEYKKVAPGGAAFPVGGIVVKQVREIPQSSSEPTITPFLLNEPMEFESVGGAFKSAGGRWSVQTRTMRMTPENIAAGSLFTDVRVETSDGCHPFTYDGPVSGLPAASYQYNAETHETTDRFEIGAAGNRRALNVSTALVGSLVAESQCPVLTLRDLTYYGSLLLRVDFESPIVEPSPFPGPSESAYALLSPPLDTDTPVNEGMRSFDLPGGGTLTTLFATVPNLSGICCPPTQLARMHDTYIDGLTTEPIVLRHPMSHVWSSGQHNWTETMIFEPFAEPRLSPRTRDELLAQDIYMIHIFTDFVSIFGPPLEITFFSAADLGITCEPCAQFTAGDLTGDGLVDGRDIDRFVAVLIDGPSGPNETCAADLDNDTSATLADAPLFVQRLIGE